MAATTDLYRRIDISWTNPNTDTFCNTEIWVATTNDRATSTLLAAPPGIQDLEQIYTHADLAPETTRYYWRRPRDFDGTLGSYEPAGATAGWVGTSAGIPPSDVVPWVHVTATSASMLTNHGYVADHVSTRVELLLPAVSVFGDEVWIVGLGAAGWKITQAAGQQLLYGATIGTVGVTGFYDSVDRFDGVILRCLTANTVWHLEFLPGGGYTDEQAQDAVGAMLDATLVYVDATPSLGRAGISGDVTIGGGSNTAAIGALKVTTGKIDDLAVTTGKLADLAVTTGKIDALAVTTGKLADGAATEGKITLADVTTHNVTSSAHGFVPKAPNTVLSFLRADATWAPIITWTEVVGTSQAMSSGQGYVPNNAGLVTLTLPTTAALGETLVIAGKGAGLWKIAQNAGQSIHLGSLSTTVGTGGSLTAPNQYTGIVLVCITANTTWEALGDAEPFARNVFVVSVLLGDPLDTRAWTVGDGKAYYRVPSDLNGWNLVGVAAHVSTVSSSGLLTFQVRNATDAVDMLSTALTIDVSEKDSTTATTAAVINAATDDVATGDEIAIDCDVAGTGTKGPLVELRFQLPSLIV